MLGVSVENVALLALGCVERGERRVGRDLAGGEVGPVRSGVPIYLAVEFLGVVGVCDAYGAVEDAVEAAVAQRAQEGCAVRGGQLGQEAARGGVIIEQRADAACVLNAHESVRLIRGPSVRQRAGGGTSLFDYQG